MLALYHNNVARLYHKNVGCCPRVKKLPTTALDQKLEFQVKTESCTSRLFKSLSVGLGLSLRLGLDLDLRLRLSQTHSIILDYKSQEGILQLVKKVFIF
jgi:hypothetical protein